MKRCPECRRDYYDDSLQYCLDDGVALLEGPVSTGELPTAIHHSTGLAENELNRLHLADTSRSSAVTQPLPRISRRAKWIAPVAVVIVVLILGMFYVYRKGDNANQVKSLAVMPLLNESGNPELEFLSDGMTETLINSLIRIPNLTVKSRDTAFRYKGKQADAQTIGRELGVNAILTGHVAQRGDDVSLSLSLIDAKSENQMWGKRYDRKMSDLVTLQNEIALDVSANLKTRLSSKDQQRLAKSPTDNAEAYQLYLKGQYLWHRRAGNWLDESLAYYQQALEKDPNFALAYVAVADSYIRMSSEPEMSGVDAVAMARPQITKALEVDKDLAEAHRTLAELKYQFEYDWEGAEQEFKTAIELNPNVPLNWLAYGWFLMSAGRFAEADTEFENVVEADPGSLSFNIARGQFFYLSRQYDRAIQHFQNIIAVEPNNPRPLGPLQNIFEQKKMYREAFEMYIKNRTLSGGMTPEQAAEEHRAFDEKGWPGFLSRRIETLQQRARTSYVNPIAFANIYARLGDKEKAFEMLEKAFTERDPFLAQLKIDPRLDALRDDPRYEAFLGRVGLTK